MIIVSFNGNKKPFSCICEAPRPPSFAFPLAPLPFFPFPSLTLLLFFLLLLPSLLPFPNLSLSLSVLSLSLLLPLFPSLTLSFSYSPSFLLSLPLYFILTYLSFTSHLPPSFSLLIHLSHLSPSLSEYFLHFSLTSLSIIFQFFPFSPTHALLICLSFLPLSLPLFDSPLS